MANDKTTPATPATPDNLVMVDANTLAATIATAVAQAMANQQNNHEAMGAVIGTAVAQGIAANTRKKVTFGEYELRRKAGRPELRRKLWQNGIEVNPNPLLPEEINLLNRLTHSGRYFDRLVEVVATEDEVFIRYNNKTPDQRFELKNHFRNLVELLTHVVEQQEAEDKAAKELEEEKLAERQKREAAKERFSFSSKTTREAREKAGVE
jgi:hypothetical protein